ncbi:nuclease A inhibitor family protein [Cellulophaga sp. BC115SP]|uniref:nuclease A inhibitor family protein n=1 Tax=Cellulophaga sp. BC115SP TaxID=2683263 RepID=UPI0014120B47|nr:nuclease A inhibitor family protein [Cellulophaga sp. BC115SP]NBB28872.1 nuclease [Cellulophaga sp. BC115SP]
MTETAINLSQEAPNLSLGEKITALVADLYYPSESDEKIEFFDAPFAIEGTPDVASLKMFLGIPPEVTTSEWDIETFFKPLLKKEDWFGEEELEWLKSAEDLHALLIANLTDIKIYRIGNIEIDVYLLGKPTEGNCVGVKTKVIET